MSALVPLRRKFLKNLPLRRILIFMYLIVMYMFSKGNYFFCKNLIVVLTLSFINYKIK